MHTPFLLTTDHIQELRQTVIKILEQNMISFSTRVSVHCKFGSPNDLDILYAFSERQYTNLQGSLQRIAQFSFQMMSNVQLIWEEVHHRQKKLLQLRESFSSATDYMEELKMENDQIRSKLSEAEICIQQIQQQKQFLDALYYHRQRATLSHINQHGRQMNRCVSQRSFRWEEGISKRKKNVNYEKLKEYIDSLKQQRQDIQKQLLGLSKKYELKCQQCKKANFFIEHLMERLNKKSQLKEYIETLNNYTNEMRGYTKNELNSEDFLKILEKTENSANNTRRSFVLLNEQQEQRNIFPCIDSFSNIEQQLQKECFSEHNISSISKNSKYPKDTKDMMVCTQKVMKKAVCCQTESLNISQQQQKGKPDYKIQIQIFGKQKTKQIQIQKIIKDLKIQEQLQSKLPLSTIKGEYKDLPHLDDKFEKINNKWMSTYQYYQKRIISNRIKKYHYQKNNLNFNQLIKIK